MGGSSCSMGIHFSAEPAAQCVARTCEGCPARQRFCAAVSSPAGLSRGLSALRFLSGAQSRQENKASPKGGRVCQA